MADEIEHGMRVRDPITGFQGIAVGKARWITGCDRIAVRGELGEDESNHTHPDLVHIDEPKLEIVDRNPSVRAAMVEKTEGRDPGGPDNGKSISK